MTQRSAAVLVLSGLVVAGAACGRKGPPLPPLRPVPAAATAVTARRIGDRVDLHFTIPTTNTDRTSPASVSKVEVYARSAPANSARPVQEQIVVKDNLVSSIDVRPPASDKQAEAPPTPAPPPDPRPATGDTVTFSETLPTTAPTPLPALRKKTPQPPAAAPTAPTATGVPGAGVIPSFSPEARGAGAVTPPATAATTPPAGAAATPPAAAAATPAAADAAKTPPKPTPPTRYYWIQAISTHGKPGAAADLIAVPLVDPPKAPTDPKTPYDEKQLTVTWTPAAEGQTFRVYDVDANGKETNKDGRPLNDTPLKTASFQVPVEFGKQRCFAIRAVDVTGNAALESEALPICVTPKDTFPPPAPTNLNGLPDNGAVQLRWDPVTAPDLAGYLVLRGEGTGDTLQPLTTAPIAAATYADATAKPGVTYVYVVVAVDTAANQSARSNSYTVTIR
jgi:hypothetical protein